MRKFRSLTMRHRADVSTWDGVHDRVAFLPGDVAIVTDTPTRMVYVRYPCCGDLVDHTDGQHNIGADKLQRITIQPSIACHGCGAHYTVTNGAIVEGVWSPPEKQAEWAARYPDPPRAGIG